LCGLNAVEDAFKDADISWTWTPMGPDALDTLNPDGILPQAPASERHSVIDDSHAPSHLPAPNPSFIPQGDSVASSYPLNPSKDEAVYLQENGGSLPLPNPSLMLQRESVASSFLVPAESAANNSLHQANSLGPLNPSKGEAASLQTMEKTPMNRILPKPLSSARLVHGCCSFWRGF
jgi:hypothetical protein